MWIFKIFLSIIKTIIWKLSTLISFITIWWRRSIFWFKIWCFFGLGLFLWFKWSLFAKQMWSCFEASGIRLIEVVLCWTLFFYPKMVLNLVLIFLKRKWLLRQPTKTMHHWYIKIVEKVKEKKIRWWGLALLSQFKTKKKKKKEREREGNNGKKGAKWLTCSMFARVSHWFFFLYKNKKF